MSIHFAFRFLLEGWFSLSLAFGLSLGQGCGLPSDPEILRSEDRLLFQRWDVEAHPALERDALPASAALHAFREGIRARLSVDPLEILERQRAHVRGSDLENVRLVLEEGVGRLRPISCLEALLLAGQAERTAGRGEPMLDHPTEFLAFVLERGERIRIYTYTVDQPGIGGLSILDEPLEEDLAAGWRVRASIHNHNFFPASPAVLGGVAPSGADVQALRSARDRYGMERAIITNGFHSLEMDGASLDRFRTP